MIRVTIKPSDVDVDPYMKAMFGESGYTKHVVLIDISIDGQALPTTTGSRLSDGRFLIFYETGVTSHPRWEEVVQVVERQLKRYFELMEGKE